MYVISWWKAELKTRNIKVWHDYIKSVNLAAKKCVRIIAKADSKAHTAPLFKKFGLLNISELCFFQTALFMFQYTRGHLPQRLNSYFVRTNSSHHYSTRSAESGYWTID